MFLLTTKDLKYGPTTMQPMNSKSLHCAKLCNKSYRANEKHEVRDTTLKNFVGDTHKKESHLMKIAPNKNLTCIALSLQAQP